MGYNHACVKVVSVNVCVGGEGASVHTLEGVPFVGMLPSKHHFLQSPETHVGDTCMCISALNTHCPEQGKQWFNEEAHIHVQYMYVSNICTLSQSTCN